MKPLTTETDDTAALAELGRASVQIVHDLKNQINGLKLYATFLRKRLEKTDGRTDELETVNKLLAGLERAAADMTTLVRYGRPLELRRAPHVDLKRVLAAALERDVDADDGAACHGEFDQANLTEALKHIDASLRAPNQSAPPRVRLRRDGADGVIEWRDVPPQGGPDGDPFNTFAGSQGLRLALAARVIRAHGGQLEHDARTLRLRLPLARAEG